MKCPSCNTVCLENANFCHICGYGLNSGKPAPATAAGNGLLITEALKRLMPSSYVDKLLASNGKSAGERRVVTILFSDVKGSTEMGESLDPEEVLTIMNSAFGVLIEPIMKYEGTLARLMGDAILAFFGAPIAHEDDPQRACRAALEIIEGAKKFSCRLEKEKGIRGFSVRVGINTGLVVVAEVGADFRVEYTAMGDAVNVASRMESSAEPGTILITEDTCKQLSGDFELQPMGPIQVKGRQGAVNAYRLLSESSAGAVKREKNLPIIGRSTELKLLTDTLYSVRSTGKGKIISIIGDCGIGKSRLAAEVQELTGDCMQWVETRSIAYHQNNSYRVIKNLLKNHLVNGGSEDLATSLRQKLNFNRKKNSEIYSVIASLLDLRKEELLPFNYEQDDAESLKGQIHYSVLEYFKAQALIRPLALLVEDLQWCDPASLELISELYSLTPGIPLVIVNTFRKADTFMWDIHLQSSEMYGDKYLAIALNSLPEHESRELIKNICSDVPLAGEMEKEILLRAEGNPFFIEQILRAYLERTKDNKTDFQQAEIPNLLQSVVMSRLDYLPPVEKTIVQTAAVIGKYFTGELVAAVLEKTLSRSELQEGLISLDKKDFINPVEERRGKNVKEYVFTQTLIQEVAYNSLLISSREKTHNEVALELEKIYNSESGDLAGTLAVHFERGKNYKKAIHYYNISALRSKQVFANKEAIYFYRQIISLSGLYAVSSTLLSEVHESLGDIHQLISDYPAALEEYIRALALEEEGRKGIIFQKRGQVYEKWGQYDNALAEYALSLQAAGKEPGSSFIAQTLLGQGMVYYRKGDLEEAGRFTGEALRLLDGQNNTFQLSECYNNSGIILARKGEVQKARQHIQKALDIRLKLNHMSGLSASYNNLGFLCQLEKNYKEAVEFYQRGIEYCEKTGNIHGLAKIYDNLSEIYISEKEREKAISYNLLAMEILGRLNHKSDLNQYLWLQSGVW